MIPSLFDQLIALFVYKLCSSQIKIMYERV